MRPYPAGYLRVLELFDVDPFAEGRKWFVDPTLTTGDRSGRDPANAARTGGDINKLAFARGDILVQRADTTLKLTEKIMNKKDGKLRMVGSAGNPFYWGCYHTNAAGDVIMGRGNKKRARVHGGDPAKYDPYGDMPNAELMKLIPTPDKNADGSFNQGSMEGLANWYQGENYDLYLWISGIEFGYSGGRAIRFTQSGSVKARGLFIEDSYVSGTMKQAFHLAGVLDGIIRNSHVTHTGVEFNYWNPPSNRQAALATKGTQGDPDTPQNVWFDGCTVYDGWSSEGINSNSGNKGAGIINSWIIDQGLYGVYLDRTADMCALNNRVIRTSREKYQDYTGEGADTGRGACGIEVQSEKHSSSFDWEGTYNTPEDFAKYQTHDSLVEGNIVAGWTKSISLHCQASTAEDSVHAGRPLGGGMYYLGNLSLDPIKQHWSFNSTSGAYNLNMENPPQIIANALKGSAKLTDSTESEFPEIWSNNHFEKMPAEPFTVDAIIGGLVMPRDDYSDLSDLMETDEHGHMSEEQAEAFKAKAEAAFRPLEAPLTNLAPLDIPYPPGYTLTEVDGLDALGEPFGEFRNVGPFAIIEGGGGNPGPEPDDEIEERVEELEREVVALDERVTALEQASVTLAA